MTEDSLPEQARPGGKDGGAAEPAAGVTCGPEWEGEPGRGSWGEGTPGEGPEAGRGPGGGAWRPRRGGVGRPSGGRWCAAGADRANGQVLERQEIRDPEGLGEVS